MSDLPTQAGDHPDDWDGGWDSHREAQERACLAVTPAQRLAWLEEAIDFAREAILRVGKPALPDRDP